MPQPLQIKIGIVGTLREKVVAAMQQIRPAFVAELTRLLLEAAARATRRASGEVVKVRSGHLRRTIGPPTVQETASGAAGELRVGATYAPFLEYGTRPHRIVARRGKALRFLDRTGTLRFARSVNHPGTRPRPFFGPSWDEMVAGPPSARDRMALALQQTVNEA